MADVIAGEDVPCSDRNFSKVNNLRPADQEKDSLKQPAAEVREHSLRNVLDGHGKSQESGGVPADMICLCAHVRPSHPFAGPELQQLLNPDS